MGLAADDAEAQDRIAAFEQGLQQSGWTNGRNLQIDYRRGGAGDTDSTRRYADELVAPEDFRVKCYCNSMSFIVRGSV